jgi:hypothetical protein
VAERDVVDVDEHFVLALLAPDLVGADKGESGQFLLVPPHNDGPPLPG